MRKFTIKTIYYKYINKKYYKNIFLRKIIIVFYNLLKITLFLIKIKLLTEQIPL